MSGCGGDMSKTRWNSNMEDNPNNQNIQSHEDDNIYHTTTLQQDKCLGATGWNSNILCRGKMRVMLSRSTYLMRPRNWENDRDLFR